MAKTIDMQLIRYINFFEKVAGVSTTSCFVYNNTIYFAVPKASVMKAVGRNGENVKHISEVFRKKIRVVPLPNDFNDAESLKNFFMEIVSPVEITGVELKEGFIVLSGSRESKAILIGRNRVRETELSEAVKTTFGLKGLKIM